MSNNDEMQVDHDRGHGLRAPNKNNEGHGSRGHTGGSRGAIENESRYIKNKFIYKNTIVITTPTTAISGLKSGA
jgi:hypothetical protein